MTAGYRSNCRKQKPLSELFLSSYTNFTHFIYFCMQNPQSPSASLSSLCPPCRHLCIVLKDFFRLRFYHTNAAGVKKKIPQATTACKPPRKKTTSSRGIFRGKSPDQPVEPLLAKPKSASRSSADKTGCIMYCFSAVFRKTARGGRKRMDYFCKYRKNSLSPKNFR